MEGVVERKMEREETYCVTGATGYIGSWLVKSLLQSGYRVHAPVRDPEKASHFLPPWGSSDRLRVFKADLQEEGSFDEAVRGCIGVFHIAAAMEFHIPPQDDIDSYVRGHIIEPAIKGTLNLLKSCSKSKSVKRVVFTSSVSTMTAKDISGKWKSVVYESCKVPIDRVWKTKSSGWVYVLSKLVSEEAAFQFSKENGIELVSVITTTVTGPFITKTVPSSIQVFLSPLTGNPLYFSLLKAVNSRMGSIALVHIEDMCNALIFLMQHVRADGQYICSADSCEMSELALRLAKHFPTSTRLIEEETSPVPSEISSKKLRDLGFNYKYGLEDIIQHTINSCLDFGFLSPDAK